LKTLIFALSTILLIGCSSQTQLYWKALQQESDSIEATPADLEPVPLSPVVHGMHKVKGGKKPRMKNAYTSMRKLGFGVLFIDIPNLGHQIPKAWSIVQALDYLDSPR